jgi:hypothetical protein
MIFAYAKDSRRCLCEAWPWPPREGSCLDAVMGPALSGQLMWLSSDR